MHLSRSVRIPSLFLLLLLLSTFLLTSCGTGGRVTEEKLRSHEAAAEEDFELSETGDECTIIRYTGKDTIVVVPDNFNGSKVTDVEPLAFSSGSGTSVKAVMLPDTVKNLERAFIDASDLELVICEGVEHIGYASFAHCPKLYNVILGSNLKTIGESAFYNCESLEPLSISSTIAVIDEGVENTVFSGCNSDFYVNAAENSAIAKQCDECGIPTAAYVARIAQQGVDELAGKQTTEPDAEKIAELQDKFQAQFKAEQQLAEQQLAD